MAGSCIGSKSTYYKCLDDLQVWGFIEYEKGINEWKAPKIKIEVLNCTATDTATVPASEPVPIPLEVTYINNKPTTENQKPLDAYSLFVQKFNEVREAKYSNKDQKAKKQFSERLKNGYTEDQILNAVKNLMKDPFHIESGFKYLTPEFMTRADKIEKGLNTISATQAKKANNPR